jgi:hypothetical protein
MGVMFEEFVERVKALEYMVKKIASELLFKRSQQIVKMNRTQLMQGKNIEEKTIQEGYSKPYAKKRQKKGLQTRFVDLYFTGKFQKGLKGVKNIEGLDIESSAEYEKYLRGNYPGIMGLNKQDAELIAQAIAEELAKQLKKYLVA